MKQQFRSIAAIAVAILIIATMVACGPKGTGSDDSTEDLISNIEIGDVVDDVIPDDIPDENHELAENERASLGYFDGYIDDEYLGKDVRMQPEYLRYFVFNDGLLASNYIAGEGETKGLLVFEVKDIDWDEVESLEFEMHITETVEETECYFGRNQKPGQKFIKTIIEVASAQSGACTIMDYDQQWENFDLYYGYNQLELPEEANECIVYNTYVPSQGFMSSADINEVQQGNTLNFELDRNSWNFQYIEKRHNNDFEVQYLLVSFTVESQCGDWTIRIEDGENTYGTCNVPILRINYKQ